MIRPAWQGEHSGRYQRSFPDAIVCVRLEWIGAFTQLVLDVPENVVDAYRGDIGEALARATYELAGDSAKLQRREMITLDFGRAAHHRHARC